VELVPGEVLEGSVDHNGSTVYRLVVDKPGQVLWVLLVGSAGTDLDLAVTLYSDTGEWLNSMSSSSLGSAEIVSQAAAQVGVYEVKVSAYGAGDDFRLLARLDSPEAILEAASSGE